MRGRGRRAALVAIGLAVIAGLVALGAWQLQRRSWKLALIAQVQARLAAAPVPAPGPAAWPAIDRTDAYRRLALDGRYRPQGSVRVQAVTDLGAGWWVLTPFDTDRGFTVLVNRGFIPADMAMPAPPAGPQRIGGLLRVTEPGGAFLRSNDPAHGRWYSRDVAAIAAAQRLGAVAPYFVAADRRSGPGWPRGGLTVVAFSNNHLVYALTWFGMAALLTGALVHLARRRDPA